MSEYKYIIFALSFVIGIPVGIILCRLHKVFPKIFTVLLIWATAEPDKVGINFFSREYYRAATRGFEVSLVDVLALILAGNLLFIWNERRRIVMPVLSIPYAIYILLAISSWVFCPSNITIPDPVTVKGYTVIPPPYQFFETALYPLFEISKILRGLFLYWLLVNYLQDREYFQTVIIGLSVTIVYLTILALKDRYLGGVHRVKTTLGHANSFSTYMAMMASMIFPLLLRTKSYFSSAFYSFLIFCSVVCVILTISRGGLLALFVGIFMTLLLTFPKIINLKNSLLFILGLFLAVIVLVKSYDTLASRFLGKQDATKDIEYRGKYNDKAKLMAKENFLGVGLGNFSAYSWNGYAARVDENLPPGTPPHNIWFVNLAELGYLGLVAFILIWVRFYSVIIPAIKKSKGDSLLHFAVIASFTTSIVLHIQSFLQLGYRQSPQFFLMMVLVSMGVAVHYLTKDHENVTKPAQRI